MSINSIQSRNKLLNRVAPARVAHRVLDVLCAHPSLDRKLANRALEFHALGCRTRQHTKYRRAFRFSVSYVRDSCAMGQRVAVDGAPCGEAQ